MFEISGFFKNFSSRFFGNRATAKENSINTKINLYQKLKQKFDQRQGSKQGFPKKKLRRPPLKKLSSMQQNTQVMLSLHANKQIMLNNIVFEEEKFA